MEAPSTPRLALASRKQASAIQKKFRVQRYLQGPPSYSSVLSYPHHQFHATTSIQKSPHFSAAHSKAIHPATAVAYGAS
jgi:hypothetical protein